MVETIVHNTLFRCINFAVGFSSCISKSFVSLLQAGTCKRSGEHMEKRPEVLLQSGSSQRLRRSVVPVKWKGTLKPQSTGWEVCLPGIALAY